MTKQTIFGSPAALSRSRCLAVLATLLVFGPLCRADQFYDISITLPSIFTGTTGGLYLQFNPGLLADPASVTVTSFSDPGGSLLSTPAPTVDGDVTPANPSLGALPLTIKNTGALNDFEQFLVFGSSLNFQVDFKLPPTLTGHSGSLLGIEVDQVSLDPQNNITNISPALTGDPSGFLGTISYDQTGIFTVDTLGNDPSILTITPVASPAVPEPASSILGMLLTGLLVSRLLLTSKTA